MAKLTRLEQIIAEKTVCVLLLRGVDAQAQRVYAYVAVRADKLKAFMMAQAQPFFAPEDYGAILLSGMGDPSTEIREKMQEEYGFNHDKMMFLGEKQVPSLAE